jgi:PleD family two-component response regulator
VQRLRERIQETRISAGVVTLRGDETMDELISRADHEMYKDKVPRHRDQEEPVFEADQPK